MRGRAARAAAPPGAVLLVPLALLFLLALLAGGAAGAHPLAPALLELVEAEAPGHFAVRWRSEPTSLAGPVLPRHCERSTAERVVVAPSGGFVERRWEVACGEAGLGGATLRIAGLAAERRDVLVRVQARDGVSLHGLVRADAPAWAVPARPDRRRVLADHLRLGAAHLAAGPDHWLFLLGLLGLVRGARRIALAVTAFTAGHAATLTLAVLGFVHAPERLVETAIAASLVALACELAARAAAPPGAPRRPSLLRRRPEAMAFAFGLVHGLGFAGALAEIGLPPGEIPLALLGFNLGIEAGQLALVAAWLGLRGLASRLPRWPAGAAPPALRLLPAYGIGALGVYWGLDRLF